MVITVTMIFRMILVNHNIKNKNNNNGSNNNSNSNNKHHMGLTIRDKIMIKGATL